MKKIKLLFISIIIIALTMLFATEVKASNTMNLNITDLRPYTSKVYSVETPNGNEHLSFKIVKNNGTSYVHEDSLYCLRSGLGFGNSATVNGLNANHLLDEDITYTETFNLKNQRDNVINYYKTELGYDRISNNEYNSILWIIDNMYLPEQDTQEMKQVLLAKVLEHEGGNEVSSVELANLTSDDIEYAEQMALWYFTNFDENGEDNSLSLYYTKPNTNKLSNRTKIDNENLENDKARAIDALYEFFIDKAKENAANYTGTSIYGSIYETTATLWLASENDQQPVLKVEREKHIEGSFKIVLEKRDENGKLLFGANFTIISEDRQNQLTVTNNGDGTFNCPDIAITEENQVFIYEIEEILTPTGYVGLNGTIKIKITTKLNTEGTGYILDNVSFINTQGGSIEIDGVTYDVENNTIKIIVENEKNKNFDLSLRKFITKVNGVKVPSKTPNVDTSKLNTQNEQQKTITTANYIHSKEPVVVKKGDIVTYTIRIYNEGELNGYAIKIVDYLPEGLGYLIDYKANNDNLWLATETNKIISLVGEDGLYKTEKAVKNIKTEDFESEVTKYTSLEQVKILTGKSKICSTALEDEIIKAYNPELKLKDIEITDDWQQSIKGTDGLYYRDIEITCIVLADNTYTGTLRNIAEIEESKAVDKKGQVKNVSDRDSQPGNVDINNYNPPANNSTYQQDDDDYELLKLQYFDLALRKFITKVNDEEITTRVPKLNVDEEGNIEYKHDKKPVYVANSDIVTYTIRVYNEGTTPGYAMEISDDIPDGLYFLPENETNKQYKWVMLDKDGNETNDPLKAVEIRTDYLNDTLLKPYDSTTEISDTNPANAEVKVAFQVLEENTTQEDRIITNKAQITEDKAVDENGKKVDIDDIDSIPNEWNEGEDDQDIEKIYVKYFDLALLKWVTKTIITVDGKTTTTETGFTPTDDPEPIAKAVIDKKKLDNTTVKFAYNIIITNQGEIEGYATEITDYIPDGLEFVAEDNPLWKKEGDNKITTRALEETLLKPGESATVEVIFRWKNSSDNLGLKTNIAEISEDYNDKGSKDIDSTPDNVKTIDYDKQQEDDDDKALVILEIKTGGAASYIWLGLIVLTILTGGIALIKKYAL